MTREQAAKQHEKIAAALDAARREMSVFGGLYDVQQMTLHALAGRALGLAAQTREHGCAAGAECIDPKHHVRRSS